MISYYGDIKLIHIVCVALSGCLFCVRGVLMLGNAPASNHWILKRLSYIIDTILLTAAILLAIVIHQYPFVQGWLTVKLLLLPVYILLGMFALRRGKTRRIRAGFFAAALAVYAFIASVAVMHDPRGWFAS